MSLEHKLDLLLAAVARIEARQVAGDILIMKQLDDLNADVEACATLQDSLMTMFLGLADQLAAAKGDAAQVEAISAKLKSEAAKMTAFVLANTPAAPPAPAPAAPTP